jgi:hypothetical protein
MSSTTELSWLAPLLSALVMWAVGIFVLVRYFQNRLRESLLWGFALVSYGFSQLMEYAFAYPLLPQNEPMYFLRQTFVAVMLALFYSGCCVIVTKRKAFTGLSTALFLAIQEVLIFYYDFTVVDFTLSSTIHILMFVIPFSIFFVAFFLAYFFSSKRTGSLLISIGWLAYAAIVPFYFLWRGTPLLPYWFVIRTISLVPLFIGFALLAYPRNMKIG